MCQEMVEISLKMVAKCKKALISCPHRVHVVFETMTKKMARGYGPRNNTDQRLSSILILQALSVCIWEGIFYGD